MRMLRHRRRIPCRDPGGRPLPDDGSARQPRASAPS